MAQPAQIFSNNSYLYSVVDNGPAGTQSSGYDTIASGANSQGKNAFGNGTVPDAVSAATTIVNSANQGIFVRYKNPA
jgi:hypothetical protein